MSKVTYRPPTRKEIYEAFHPEKDTADALEMFNRSLNVEPHKDWIKTHNGTKNEYLPIECVEFLLTYFFQRWSREVIKIEHIANAIVATVRLKVWHPILQDWWYHDGVGAVPIQLAGGSKAYQLENINAMALQLNVPAAVSFATSNAAGQFGKVFGRDILRKNGGVDYIPLLNLDQDGAPQSEEKPTPEEIKQEAAPVKQEAPQQQTNKKRVINL